MNSTTKKINPEFDRAVACAIASLAKREKFSAEIRLLLVEKGFDQELADQAINYLAGRNILNDLRCAHLAVSRMAAKGNTGRARIQAALQARGATPEIIAAVLPPEPSADSLVSLLQKHFPKGADLPKAVRYLCSRGFEEEEAVSAAEKFVLFELESPHAKR